MAMPYLASPLSLGNIQGADYLNSLPNMDLPDHRSNFDSETFVRCVTVRGCTVCGLLTVYLPAAMILLSRSTIYPPH